jgi:hypothetical protein
MTGIPAWLMNVKDEEGYTVHILSFSATVYVIDTPPSA